MIGTEPDAWDECATCGHDRDEHDRFGCLAPGPMRLGARACPCVGFVDGPEAA